MLVFFNIGSKHEKGDFKPEGKTAEIEAGRS